VIFSSVFFVFWNVSWLEWVGIIIYDIMDEVFPDYILPVVSGMCVVYYMVI